MKKQYTNAFKTTHIKEALRATESHEISLVGYAKKHGIPHTTLHQWVNQYKRGSVSLEKKQSFIELTSLQPTQEQVEAIVITTSYCSLTLPTSITSLDLMKLMKSIKEVSLCS